MNTGTKYELMQNILEELANLKNSQTVALEKINQLEKQNIELADTQLEMKLDDLYETIAMNAEKTKTAFSFFQQKVNEFAIQNHFQTEAA